jgi:hypothetical protein
MQDGSKGSVQTVTHVSSLRAGVAINPIAILISLPPRPVQFCRQAALFGRANISDVGKNILG